MRRRPVVLGMSSPADRLREVRPAARLFTLLVVAATVGGFAAAAVGIGAGDVGRMLTRPELYVLMALIVIADLYPVVPWMGDVRGRVRIHFSGAFTLALALVCGPPAVVLFPLISVISQGALPTALWRRVFNSAVLTAEGLLGFAAVYVVFGPWPDAPDATRLLLAGAVMAATWEVVNVMSVCTALTLVDRTPLLPLVALGLRRTLPWLAALLAAPLIAFGTIHATVLIPSFGLLTILIHHAIAATIRASDDARRDQLTGLANRTGALEQLDDLLQAPDSAAEVILIMIDLDDFKSINDDHGHAIGDQVLATVGARLRDRISDPHLAARLGGDEFVVIGNGSRADGERLGSIVHEALSRPLAVATHLIDLRCSVGVATVPVGTAPLDALRAADTQMYAAKMGRADRQRVVGRRPPRETRSRGGVIATDDAAAAGAGVT